MLSCASSRLSPRKGTTGTIISDGALGLQWVPACRPNGRRTSVMLPISSTGGLCSDGPLSTRSTPDCFDGTNERFIIGTSAVRDCGTYVGTAATTATGSTTEHAITLAEMAFHEHVGDNSEPYVDDQMISMGENSATDGDGTLKAIDSAAFTAYEFAAPTSVGGGEAHDHGSITFSEITDNSPTYAGVIPLIYTGA